MGIDSSLCCSILFLSWGVVLFWCFLFYMSFDSIILYLRDRYMCLFQSCTWNGLYGMDSGLIYGYVVCFVFFVGIKRSISLFCMLFMFSFVWYPLSALITCGVSSIVFYTFSICFSSCVWSVGLLFISTGIIILDS